MKQAVVGDRLQEVKGSVVYRDARRALRVVALASGPRKGIAISSDAHCGYFLSPTYQLVFPRIFVLPIFTKSKDAPCVSRDVRLWAQGARIEPSSCLRSDRLEKSYA